MHCAAFEALDYFTNYGTTKTKAIRAHQKWGEPAVRMLLVQFSGAVG